MHGLSLRQTEKVLQLPDEKKDEIGRKPNKKLVDKDSEVYNRSMKSWLQYNDIEMSSTHYEGKSVVVEIFTITLKGTTYKYTTSISKTVYIGELDDIVNKYKNTCHTIIKMKPTDVKLSTYIDFNVENNDKYPKLEVGDHIRISKTFLQKVTLQIGLKKFF